MADARVIPLHPRRDAAGRAEDTAAAAAGSSGSAADAPTADTAVTDTAATDPPAGRRGRDDTEPAAADVVAEALAFLRQRWLGEYDVDSFGFDPELAERVWYPALRPFFEKWFRVETFGLDNVPADGGALVAANHSGTLPWDALMTSVAVHDHHPAQRHLRMLGADLVFRLPVVSALARRAGHTLACRSDAERLLLGGELTAVWPEGFKGIGKPFQERYKLQRFGRGGFVSTALRTGAPIVPCAIVGAEEIYPKIGDVRPLARLLGLPYFPVTPLFPLFGPLGAVPLPTKWYIEFGEPVRTDSYAEGADEDPMVVFSLSDQVRDSIQRMLYRLLSQRATIFLG